MDDPRRRSAKCRLASPDGQWHRLDDLAVSEHEACEHHRDPLVQVSALVGTGPFRFSRNPIYLADAITYVGGALLSHGWWPLLLPEIVVIMRPMVVDREERYLAEHFARAYRRYQLHVRRWI
jgi:protein-S-isoprenylcysteine O-methyltransferase Ste14